MKTSLWIEDGKTQIVLTPENEFEQNILHETASRKVELIVEGGFYHCNGGWDRQDTTSESLIIVLKNCTKGLEQ